MKKILFIASAVAALFLAGSCQRENLEPVEQRNTVTYTVQVPGALATKAANGFELLYEVYRQDNTLVYESDAPIAFGQEGKVQLSLEFVKDQTFTVLFWAQNSGCTAYNVGDLRSVTLADNLKANDENAEAFAGKDVVTNCVSAAENGNVVLVRPIAQINIATLNESLSLGVQGSTTSPVNPQFSEISVDGLYTSYNVATGEVLGNAAEVNFSKTQILPDADATDLYKPVGMSYIGFMPKAGDNVVVDFKIYTENDGEITHTVSNVPVKANYKTNIIGNLITATDNYQVTLGAWGTEETNVEVVAVSTAQDLQEAIDNIQTGAEGNIILEGNIDLGTLAGMISTKAAAPTFGLKIPADKSLVLDLNGNTLAQEVNCTASYSMIENHGSLTIIDSKGEGKISFKDSGAGDPSFGWGSYTISNNGTLVVNNGTIEHIGEQNTPGNVVHMYCAIQQNNANAVTTINGGTISTPTYRSIRICRGTANIKGGDMIGQVWAQPFDETIVLNIEGGNFQPTGGDGSSVFVTNNKAVDFAVTGGFFATKVSCSVPANLAGTVTGGTFTASAKENTPEALYAGYMFVEDGQNYILEPCPVKIGESAYYATLAAAVDDVQEGETITILAGKTLAEGTIKLPATLKNVTFAGEEGATLKDMTISAADGNSYNYEGLTFDGITFDNSRILLTGWRNGDETIKNLTVTNCVFKNLYDTTNSAPVHINKDAPEPVNGFTFTNNVIDGATGGSKSGIYVQVTGDVLVSGNIINNVSFRPYVIQVTTDDNVADNFVVTNNTFSGSAAGRAQGLGSNAEGTDAVNVVVTENIFKGITESQQICYWNFNPAKTTSDLSHNYYDIDILNNPGKIYFNNSASNVYDLVDMGIFPIYTDETKTTTFTPEVNAAKIGDTEYATLADAFNVGGEITLLCNVTVTETVVLAEGKTVVLDLNGKTLAAADMNVVKNNGGNLTIKNGTVTRTGDVVGYSVNNASGEIAVENATIQRGLYTSGSKMTATNANISHEQSSRHAIYAWNCEVTINSGTFHNGNAGNATFMASGSSVVTINGGTFSIADGRSTLGWTSSMIDQNSTAQVVVKGGLFNGGFRINSADTKLTIEGGEFNTNNGSAFTDYSGTKVVKGGKFTDAGAQNWAKKYIADGYEMNANGEVVAK